MPQKLDESNYPSLQFIKDFWQYTGGLSPKILFWSLIRGIGVLQGMLNPVIYAKIIDQLANRTLTFQSAVLYLAVIFVNTFIQSQLRLTSKYQVSKLGEQARLLIRQKAISQFINFDLSWHEKENSGKKITVITNGADSTRRLVNFLTTGGGGVDIVFNIIGVLIIFLTANPKYFLLAVINTIVYIGVNQVINKQLTQKWHGLNKEYERVIGKNFDYFSNIGLIKRLGIGNQVNLALFKKEQKYTFKNIEAAKMGNDKWRVINTISITFQTITMGLVIFDIINGRISVGSFVIYTTYLGRLQDNLGNIASWIENLINLKLSFWRLIQLTRSGTIKTDIGSADFPKDFSSVTVNNLSFTYPRSKNNILKDINLKIQSGEKIGLVGESGSGKSTFVKLLLRLYLLNRGLINIGNVNINKIRTESLRRHMAIVPQDSEVFNLTFKENITIASESTKFNQNLYDLALTIAECQPILAKIKNNHNAILGEKGIKLSGGERQRLGIARAIYKNSPIMIFDEATSSLDSKTEEKILTNIETYLANKTILWIAHRLSTLRFTDRIVVFDKGKIVENASFDSLIANQGIFYQLWSLQKKTRLVENN